MPQFFEPIKRAESLRPKIYRNGKFLIAKIEGTGQEPSKEKILETYFRYKNYMKNKEWFSASPEEVWSPKFLGLNEDFRKRNIREVKKLEFQNPAYSAAFRLGGDPRNYSKVFTVQLAGCNFDCNYCYVPPHLKTGDEKFGKYFSPEEIVTTFFSIREKSEEPMNVVRISGGEPMITPEIIPEIYDRIDKNIYLWIDTNLSVDKYLKEIESSLNDILKKRNVGVVGCFKGVCKEDFSLLTGAEGKFYNLQFDIAKWFLDQKTDFYVYLPALVYENNVERKMEEFLLNLQKLHRNLPLRLELLPIIDYPAAIENMKRCEKLGRPMPKTSQYDVFEIWYKKLLPHHFSEKELKKYCCQVLLND